MVSAKWLGTLEYSLRRRHFESRGGPLNAQQLRRQVFLELLEIFRFQAVVETGAYRGDTTGFFAQESGLPVYSVEVNARYYSYAKRRLGHHRRVNLTLGDSPGFLSALVRDRAVPKAGVFFYLDAHWGEYLPLRDEIKLILQHWQESVMMIDDFRVPGDDGYGYGTCAGEELCLGYLKPLSRFGLVAFPAASSSCESGARRGCVVLATRDAAADALAAAKSLRRYGAEAL
jgi:hypothetical protein